ncbi:unnamed protein product [Calypogeia fissa]
MAQALVNCIANIVPRSDLLQKGDIERKQRTGGTSSSYLVLHQCSFHNRVGLSTSRASKLSRKKRYCCGIRCSSKSASLSEAEDQRIDLQPWDLDASQRPFAGLGVEFKLSDFELCSHVSVGLAGRGDEVLFEGVVRNPESPLKGLRVVLRQLASRRAQLWGQRALQVLSKLARREDLSLSYATQVHGYIRGSSGPDQNATLTLVHGYHGSYSLHQWLHFEDWLSELETSLSLDEEAVRRIGDDRTGGPAVSRQLRLIRILMRDLLIGVNYMHSRGYAHTQLHLKNLQVSEADRHVKVGLLGHAALLPGNRNEIATSLGANASKSSDTRQLMIAYDIRCVGFIMAKIVLRELMCPSTFALFKSFLTQGHDPAGLREMFIGLVNKGSPSDNPGIQVLDRDGGMGWNLLAEMLAIKPADRISCKDALRHPFLCGPMWRVEPSMELTRWSIGSTTVRIVEEYIYGLQQRNRLSKLVESLERMNPNSTSEEWAELACGRWRLLYHTGPQTGLTMRKASPAVMMKGVTLDIKKSSDSDLSINSEIKFTAMSPDQWPHDKTGVKAVLKVSSPSVSLGDGERLYLTEVPAEENHGSTGQTPAVELGEQAQDTAEKGNSRRHQRRSLHLLPDEPGPASLPIIRMFSDAELEFEMELGSNGPDSSYPHRVLNEVRRQIPREMFDLSRLVCGTYIDSRLMVLRSVSGSACLFTRSPLVSKSGLLK